MTAQPQSRDDFPRMLNEIGLLGVAVEVGVNLGYNSEIFRRGWRGDLLVCVDTWGPYTNETPEQREAAYAEACARLALPGVNVLRATSVEAAAIMAKADRRLDFVYIDGDHSYEGVTADLEAWWPLVRPGGIIAGHDWIPDGWRHYGDGSGPARAPVREGLSAPGWPCFVRQAVRDFFMRLHSAATRDGLTTIHKTAVEADSGWQSWWVRK